MKYVAYYQKPAPTNYLFVAPTAIGTTEVPDGKNIYQHAGEVWICNNVILADPHGYDSPQEAMSAAKAAQNEYINRRLKKQ